MRCSPVSTLLWEKIETGHHNTVEAGEQRASYLTNRNTASLPLMVGPKRLFQLTALDHGLIVGNYSEYEQSYVFN